MPAIALAAGQGARPPHQQPVTRRLLRWFGAAQRPAAWLLMAGGAVTFVAVALDLIATGEAKWATLLIAADLTVSGFSAVQESENELDSEAAA